MKTVIEDPVVRTLKEDLNRTYKWTDILWDLVENYNQQKHSKIKMSPA